MTTPEEFWEGGTDKARRKWLGEDAPGIARMGWRDLSADQQARVMEYLGIESPIREAAQSPMQSPAPRSTAEPPVRQQTSLAGADITFDEIEEPLPNSAAAPEELRGVRKHLADLDLSCLDGPTKQTTPTASSEFRQRIDAMLAKARDIGSRLQAYCFIEKLGEAKAYYDEGVACFVKGEYDKAIAEFTEVIRLDLEDAKAEHSGDNAYVKKDDFDKAIAIMAEAYCSRGVAYFVSGEYDKAIADYTEAIRLDPMIDMTYVGRADAYRAKGDYDRAFADYREVVRIAPDFWDATIAGCSETIRLCPNDATEYCRRGTIYAKKGDLDAAIADYTEAIQLDPKLAVAYSNRSRVYALKGESGRANRDFDEARSLGFDVPAR